MRHIRPSRPRRLAILWLVCFILALALQIPIAWAFAWSAGRIFSVIKPGAVGATILSPDILDTDTETISVEAHSLPGARVVTVIAHPPMTMSRRYLEHNLNRPGGPEVMAASEPWLPAELHPALVDPASWPPRTGVYSRPNGFFNAPLLTRHASGWPFYSVEGRIDYSSAGSKFTLHGIFVDPRFSSMAMDSLGQLCYLPRWPAYIADALIHATLLAVFLYLLSLTFRGTIARRRIRRGLCAHCKYDLRATPAHTPCPECGRPSPPRPTT